MSKRATDIRDFYQMMASAGRARPARKLSDCTGRMAWPQRGIYFFMEEGEWRSDSGTGPRVVRVGTHALKMEARTTLWNRLSQHRGTSNNGGGNHRGSIFRLIVGASLLARDEATHPTWGHGSNAPKHIRSEETMLERRVSGILGTMQFLWLSVPDAPGPGSVRGYIERNSIALLSNYERSPLDAPSSGWLGLHSDRERVRKSGLWNSNHVDEQHDSGFLHALEDAIVAAERDP